MRESACGASSFGNRSRPTGSASPNCALGDFHKEERQRAAAQTAVARGKMTFADALQTYRERLKGDQSLKDRSKTYREERIAALLKSWPDWNQTDVAQISKGDCLAWAARFWERPPALRLSTIPSERSSWFWTSRLRRARVTTIRPSTSNGKRFGRSFCSFPAKSSSLNWLTTIRNGDGGWAERCADLVEFLAYSGCRNR
jgi:hypothetical protein